MTAPDPRVGEIEDRLAAVPAKGESQFVGLALPVAATTELWNLRQLARADVAYLLAELRKAREALARVEGVATDLATRGAAIESKGYNGSINSNINEGRSIGYLEGARHIRAAVAASNGDGNG